jgi:hypothetical protein
MPPHANGSPAMRARAASGLFTKRPRGIFQNSAPPRRPAPMLDQPG